MELIANFPQSITFCIRNDINQQRKYFEDDINK